MVALLTTQGAFKSVSRDRLVIMEEEDRLSRIITESYSVSERKPPMARS